MARYTEPIRIEFDYDKLQESMAKVTASAQKLADAIAASRYAGRGSSRPGIASRRKGSIALPLSEDDWTVLDEAARRT